jgi:hypothetical protein
MKEFHGLRARGHAWQHESWAEGRKWENTSCRCGVSYGYYAHNGRDNPDGRQAHQKHLAAVKGIS